MVGSIIIRSSLAICTVILVLGCRLVETTNQNSSSVPPSRLVVGLDGVGYTTFKKLQDGGHFRDFQPVAPAIATYPSISDPNWTRILGTELMEGFTKAYFDSQSHNGRGQVRGNLLDHVNNPTPYERGFDYKPDGLFEHIATMAWTNTSGIYWLDSLEKKFFTSRTGKKTYFAFIMNTDLIAHTGGELELMNYLIRIDQRIRRMRENYKKQFNKSLEVIFVSDHGNDFGPVTMIRFEELLKSKGWVANSQLTTLKDFVFVAPEILSFASFHVLPESEEAFSKDMIEVEGVDLVFRRVSDNSIEIRKKGLQKSAIVHVDPLKRTLRYTSNEEKDPLQHFTFFKNKPILSFDDYFQLSKESAYPYGLVRIWEAFYLNSKQRPSVLVSTAKGYAFSNPTLELVTSIKGLNSIHGSLRKEDSYGIVVSTHEALEPMRPEDFGKKIDITEFGKN